MALFFSFDVSLETWVEKGLLTREMRLYEALMARGVKLTFLTWGGAADHAIAAPWPGVRVLPVYERLPKASGWPARVAVSLLAPFVFRRALGEAGVFKTNQVFGGWVAAIAARLCRRPLIARGGYEYYHFVLQSGRGWLKRAFARTTSAVTYRSARLIALSTRAEADFAIETFRLDPAKVRLHSNWIDTELFRPPANENAADARPGRVLYIGRFSPEKNVAFLIRAAAEAGCGLDLLGAGELEGDYRRLAAETGADIGFLGQAPNHELPALIGRYPVFALGSRHEGHPKALLEAMACGRAVATPDAPGFRGLIEDGVNGRLVEATVPAFARALGELMADPAGRAALGARARADIVANCSFDAAVARELDFMTAASRGD